MQERIQSLTNCFLQWLRTDGRDLLREIAVIRRRHRVDIEFRRFPHTLSGRLCRNTISVAAVNKGECWDYVFDADVSPKRTSAGWVCTQCLKPQVFGSRAELYRDHLFEPLRVWVLKLLAEKKCVEFRDFGGSTMAKLRPEPEVPPIVVQRHILNTRRRNDLEQAGASRDEMYAFDRRTTAEIEQLWREHAV